MKLNLLFTGLLVLLAVACGKDDKSSSSSNAFRSGLGTDDGYVLIPVMGGQPMIAAGGGTYQIQPMNQQVIQVINAMYSGQIQPYRVDSQFARFRARISGSLNQYSGSVNGYSVGGYQPPVQSNVLYVQSIQPI
jgi:hypothetical protein